MHFYCYVTGGTAYLLDQGKEWCYSGPPREVESLKAYGLVISGSRDNKGDGHLGSMSAHGKLFIKPHDFNAHCQLDRIKLDLSKSKSK